MGSEAKGTGYWVLSTEYPVLSFPFSEPLIPQAHANISSSAYYLVARGICLRR